MKLVKMETLIDKGTFSSDESYKTVLTHIKKAIKAVEWPPGSGSFTIHKQSVKKRGEGSGVKPIKEAFMTLLRTNGWC